MDLREPAAGAGGRRARQPAGRRTTAPGVVARLAVLWLAFNGLSGLWAGDLLTLYYFSNLSALGSLVVAGWGLVADLRRRGRVPTGLLLAVLSAEVVTAVVAHTLIPAPPATAAVTLGLSYFRLVHEALPAAVLVLYLLEPHRPVVGRHVLVAVLPPTVYLVGVLAAAPFVHGVPYAFLDGERGPVRVVLACLACLAVAAGTAGLAYRSESRRRAGPIPPG